MRKATYVSMESSVDLVANEQECRQLSIKDSQWYSVTMWELSSIRETGQLQFQQPLTLPTLWHPDRRYRQWHNIRPISDQQSLCPIHHWLNTALARSGNHIAHHHEGRICHPPWYHSLISNPWAWKVWWQRFSLSNRKNTKRLHLPLT